MHLAPYSLTCEAFKNFSLACDVITENRQVIQVLWDQIPQTSFLVSEVFLLSN